MNNHQHSYDPLDEFEEGAVEVSRAYNRWLNSTRNATIAATDTSLVVLWPILHRHRVESNCLPVCPGCRESDEDIAARLDAARRVRDWFERNARVSPPLSDEHLRRVALGVEL